MLPNTFVRIKDDFYNVNTIQQISFFSTEFMSEHGPIVRVIILFFDAYDIKCKNFYTYQFDLEKLSYNWKDQKSSLFELYFLSLEEVREINEQYKNRLNYEIYQAESDYKNKTDEEIIY